MRIGVRYSTDWSLIEGRCRPDAAIPRTYVQGSVRGVCLLMGTGAWSTTPPLIELLGVLRQEEQLLLLLLPLQVLGQRRRR